MNKNTDNNLNITKEQMEMLQARMEFFKKLGSIQTKYSIPSLSILQYYAEQLEMDMRKDISKSEEEILVRNATKGNKKIIKNVIDVCKACSLNEDEQENFYRLILDNGKICDYFLSNNSENIIKQISQYNCDRIDKMMFLIKDIDSEFDFSEYFKNYYN